MTPDMAAQRRGYGAIVLGLHLNGLSALQHLAGLGIPLIGLDDRPRQVGFRSRYGRKQVCPSPEREEGPLLQFLHDLRRSVPWRGVLLPTNDQFTLFVSKHRRELQESFEFALAPPGIVEALLDKWKFAHLVERHGLAGPLTRCPASEAELAAISGDLAFPCVVKPVMTSMWKGTDKGKACLVASPTELVAAWRRLSAAPGDLLIQEMIPGPDHDGYLYFAYYDRAAHPAVEVAIRKIRQHPPRFGTACVAETVHMPELIERSRQLLSAIGYRGLVDVEFKRDSRDGQLKVIEVNPRMGLQHELAARAGADLLGTAYRDLVGTSRLPASLAYKVGIKWVEPAREVESAHYYLAQGELSLGAWRQSLRGTRVYAGWRWRDPWPALGTVHRPTVRAAMAIAGMAMGALGRMIRLPWAQRGHDFSPPSVPAGRATRQERMP